MHAYTGALMLAVVLSFNAMAEAKKKPNGPDFVALAQAAYPEGAPPNRDAMDALWVALFKLPQWHLLMTPASAAQQAPSAQQIEGTGWLLVFTDSVKLRAYAKANQNLAADGSALFLSMTAEQAKDFIAGYAQPGVTGVRFNEGDKKGWFAPLGNVGAIYGFLKKNGKI